MSIFIFSDSHLAATEAIRWFGAFPFTTSSGWTSWASEGGCADNGTGSFRCLRRGFRNRRCCELWGGGGCGFGLVVEKGLGGSWRESGGLTVGRGNNWPGLACLTEGICWSCCRFILFRGCRKSRLFACMSSHLPSLHLCPTKTSQEEPIRATSASCQTEAHNQTPSPYDTTLDSCAAPKSRYPYCLRTGATRKITHGFSPGNFRRLTLLHGLVWVAELFFALFRCLCFKGIIVRRRGMCCRRRGAGRRVLLWWRGGIGGLEVARGEGLDWGIRSIFIRHLGRVFLLRTYPSTSSLFTSTLFPPAVAPLWFQDSCLAIHVGYLKPPHKHSHTCIRYLYAPNNKVKVLWS